MRGDKERHFNGVTNYDKVWRKGSGKRGLEFIDGDVFVVCFCFFKRQETHHKLPALIDTLLAPADSAVLHPAKAPV